MFELDSCVAFITSKASKKMADTFNKRLQALGTTRVQWTALYYLGKLEGISQKELAERMNIKNSTVARLLDRMEKEGLVNRVKDPADRRVTKLFLTEKGRKLREELLPEGEKMSRIFSQGIDSEDMAVFHKVLFRISENVSKLP